MRSDDYEICVMLPGDWATSHNLGLSGLTAALSLATRILGQGFRSRTAWGCDWDLVPLLKIMSPALAVVCRTARAGRWQFIQLAHDRAYVEPAGSWDEPLMKGLEKSSKTKKRH